MRCWLYVVLALCVVGSVSETCVLQANECSSGKAGATRQPAQPIIDQSDMYTHVFSMFADSTVSQYHADLKVLQELTGHNLVIFGSLHVLLLIVYINRLRPNKLPKSPVCALSWAMVKVNVNFFSRYDSMRCFHKKQFFIIMLKMEVNKFDFCVCENQNITATIRARV